MSWAFVVHSGNLNFCQFLSRDSSHQKAMCRGSPGPLNVGMPEVLASFEQLLPQLQATATQQLGPAGQSGGTAAAVSPAPAAFSLRY